MLCTSAPPFFFFNDTATTEIYTLSLHDALPISAAAEFRVRQHAGQKRAIGGYAHDLDVAKRLDRKSTRLNSSHQIISYAVFCLKKKRNSLNTFEHCAAKAIRRHVIS